MSNPYSHLSSEKKGIVGKDVRGVGDNWIAKRDHEWLRDEAEAVAVSGESGEPGGGDPDPAPGAAQHQLQERVQLRAIIGGGFKIILCLFTYK